MACVTQTARAYEYVFDFSSGNNYERTVDAGGTNITYSIKNADGATLVKLIVTVTNKEIENTVKINEQKGKLYIPDGSRLRVTLSDGYNLRQIQFGYFEKGNGNGNCGQLFGPGITKDNLKDVTGILSGSTDEHVFVKGMPSGTVSLFTNTTIWTPVIHEQGGCYLGPKVKVYSEGISLEDLAYAEGNVRLQNHKIDHDLVGVSVQTIDGNKYLIARSADQLQNHRQVMAEGQESFKDDKGNVYPWSNPNTPQYAWVIIDMNGKNNPEDFVGKRFSGVRGTYCKYDQAPSGLWIFWVNPTIILTDALDLSKATDEATELNTYPLANFVLPKDDNHFLLKPNLAEMCNVVDVMRSHGDHFIYVPDRNAIMPEVKKTDENGNEIIVASDNFYVDNDLTYGRDYSYASFIDNNAEREAYLENDIDLLGQGNEWMNWRLYDKVYHFDNTLVVAATHANNGEYVYPLSVPNQEHTETTSGMVMHIIGKGELCTYDTDMFVGSQDYWSRYQYNENRNAYRNDLVFALSNPDVKDMGTLSVWRCNDQGEKLAKIGELRQQDQWNLNTFILNSLDDAKIAKDDPMLQSLGKDPYFPNNQIYQLGQNQQNGQGKVTMMYMTDMFYSETMNNANENASLSKDYAYRLESTKDGVTSVVGYAPVYKTNDNVVTRATYTQEQVDADVDNKLEDNKKAEINFTPNMAKAMTEYRVYKGDDQTCSLFNSVASNDIVLANNFLSEAFEDEIVDGTVYVPELYTAYNNNTYGCYKQSVSDASVYMNVHDVMASVMANNGVRYCHAIIDLTSAINNVAKDSRYLLRVWRKVGNNPLVLLNTEKEKTGDAFTGEDGNGGTYDWQTNYSSLESLGMEADAFAKTNPQTPFILYDTFKVGTVAGAPGMKADNIAVEPITYYATLYVKDDASEKYYVKKIESEPVTNVPTAISTVNTGAQVESVRYYNTIGVESETPFQGLNIVVTRYSDGTTTTVKAVR